MVSEAQRSQVKAAACSRPPRRRSSSQSSSVAARCIASRQPVKSCGSMKQARPPSTSDKEPAGDDRTAPPAASISSGGKPKPSSNEGNTSARAPA